MYIRIYTWNGNILGDDMTDKKPYEVTICVFRRGEDSFDDTLLAYTSIKFETIQAAIAWVDKAGVVFK